MAARSANQMDEPEDVKRTIYISMVPDDASASSERPAANCVTAMKKLLKAVHMDPSGRSVEFFSNDPTELAGENSAAIRKGRSEATDFVGLLTLDYISNAVDLCKKGEDPDLVVFIKKKMSGEGKSLRLWLMPLNQMRLDMLSFPDKQIKNLNFPWWHGRKDDEDMIPQEKFVNEVIYRTQMIVAHPDSCEHCRQDT